MSVSKQCLIGILYTFLWLVVILVVFTDKPVPENIPIPTPEYQTGWDPDEVRVLKVYKFEGSLEGTFTPDE